MAIYSCNLRSIGRSTHDAGTAGAHIRYISRPDAEPEIFAQHMPDEHREARTWLDNAERASRKNARVIDKIRIALPRELSEEQRRDLVEEFMIDLTEGRIPWYAAIHQTGKDAHNPHVHIAVHDRDVKTNERVLRLSDNARERIKAGLPGPKAVDWIRERWEVVCNEALAQAGAEVRIDRRTLKAQGIDREPTIHEGPRAQHINDKVHRPDSKKRINGCGRVIDYRLIDEGRTRREFNAHIIDLNLERAARSKNPVTAAWALFEKDQIVKDKALEDRLAAEQHEPDAQNFASLYRPDAAYTGRTQPKNACRRQENAGEVRDHPHCHECHSGRTAQRAERQAEPVAYTHIRDDRFYRHHAAADGSGAKGTFKGTQGGAHETERAIS